MNVIKNCIESVTGVWREVKRVLKLTRINDVLPINKVPTMDVNDQTSWSIQRRKTMGRGEGI